MKPEAGKKYQLGVEVVEVLHVGVEKVFYRYKSSNSEESCYTSFFNSAATEIIPFFEVGKTYNTKAYAQNVHYTVTEVGMRGGKRFAKAVEASEVELLDGNFKDMQEVKKY